MTVKPEITPEYEWLETVGQREGRLRRDREMREFFRAGVSCDRRPDPATEAALSEKKD